MAALEFPLNPSMGDTYTGDNNVIYYWTGQYWQANDQEDLKAEFVNITGDNMTGALTLGEVNVPKITLNPTGTATFAGGNAKIFTDGAGYFNGTTDIGDYVAGTSGIRLLTDGSADFTGDVQSTSQNTSQLAGFRNQIINGDFRIWQRGTNSTLNGSGYWSADRWYVHTNGSSTQYTRLDASDQIPDAPCPYVLRFVPPASTQTFVRQCIELTVGMKTPFTSGSVWTLSWYSNRNGNVAAQPAGVECYFAESAAGVGNSVANTVGPISNIGGNRYSCQVTITNAAISSVIKCLRVDFANPAVTDYQMTGVQLEPGPVATPFEQIPIQTELALCQRYYCDQAIDQESPAKDAYYFMSPTCRFPVQMPTGPTVTVYSAGVTGSYAGGDANVVTELNTNQYPATYNTTRACSVDYIAANAFRISSSGGQLNAGNFTYHWSYFASAEL